MAKLILSLEGSLIREVPLDKERIMIGRKPSNEIQIENLAVSGEHAALQVADREVYVEDLNSTNGTYVNGKAVKKQLLQNGDSVEIGKYKIRFVNDAAGDEFERTMVVKPGSGGLAPLTAPPPPGAPAGLTAGTGRTDMAQAAIKVLSGAAVGREVPLIKVVTTIGKPGVAVAAITRRPRGFVIHHVEGEGKPELNGVSIGADPVALKSGDLIELAGTQMQFIQT